MAAHLRSLLFLLFLFCCIQCHSDQAPPEVAVLEDETDHKGGVHVVVTSCQYHGYSYDLFKGDPFYMLSVKGEITSYKGIQLHGGKVIIVAVPSTGELSLDVVDEYLAADDDSDKGKILWKKDTMIYYTDFDNDNKGKQNIDCVLSKDDHVKLSKGEYIICMIYNNKEQSYYSLYDRRHAVGTIVVRDSQMDFSKLKSVLEANKMRITEQELPGKSKSLNFSKGIGDNTVIPDNSRISFLVVKVSKNTNETNEIVKKFLMNRTFKSDNDELDNDRDSGVYVVPAQFEQDKVTAQWSSKLGHLDGAIDVYLYIENQDGYVYYPLIFGHRIVYTVQEKVSLNRDESDIETTLCKLSDSSSDTPLLRWLRVDTKIQIDNAPSQGSIYILLTKDVNQNIKNVKGYLKSHRQGTGSKDMSWYVFEKKDTAHHIVLGSGNNMQPVPGFSHYKVFIVERDDINANGKITWESDYVEFSKNEGEEMHQLSSVPFGDNKYFSKTIISEGGVGDQGYNLVESLYRDQIKVMKEMFTCFHDQIGFVVYANTKTKGDDSREYQYQVMSDVENALNLNGSSQHGSGGDFLIIDHASDIPKHLFTWINSVHTKEHEGIKAYLMVWRLDQGKRRFLPLSTPPGCRMLEFS